VSKPDDITWHEYLKGYGKRRWRQPDHERRYDEIIGLLQPLYALMWGNLLNTTGPKEVIAEPTPLPVQAKGHPPFMFRLQCKITGRMSLIVPYERMIEFGILTDDTLTGGPHSKKKLHITDRVSPLSVKLSDALSKVAPYWDDNSNIPWDERYSEYLRSPEWLEIRSRILERDDYRCQWTGKASRPGDPLQVHHLTYDRIGCEQMTDLITVCRSAHKNHHRSKEAA